MTKFILIKNVFDISYFRNIANLYQKRPMSRSLKVAI